MTNTPSEKYAAWINDLVDARVFLRAKRRELEEARRRFDLDFSVTQSVTASLDHVEWELENLVNELSSEDG